MARSILGIGRATTDGSGMTRAERPEYARDQRNTMAVVINQHAELANAVLLGILREGCFALPLSVAGSEGDVL